MASSRVSQIVMNLGILKWVCGLALFSSALGAKAAAPAPPADIRRDSTVEAVQRVMPAVVNIRTETVAELRDPFEQLMREFWGPYYNQRNRTPTTYSLGL